MSFRLLLICGSAAFIGLSWAFFSRA